MQGFPGRVRTPAVERGPALPTSLPGSPAGDALCAEAAPSTALTSREVHGMLRTDRMTATKPRQYYIQGITRAGRTFRPSDWAERLAGAMSSFRPKGGGGIGAHIGYSPYCVPQVIDGVKCVIVSEALADIEPMAWDFVMNFARDNELQVVDACLLPGDSPSSV